MKDNLFTKVVLIVAVFLLFLNLIGFVYSPSSSYAAKSFQYKVVGSDAEEKNIEKELNKLSGEGWELVTVQASTKYVNLLYLIFKK